jgi:hypothetical protein
MKYKATHGDVVRFYESNQELTHALLIQTFFGMYLFMDAYTSADECRQAGLDFPNKDVGIMPPVRLELL